MPRLAHLGRIKNHALVGIVISVIRLKIPMGSIGSEYSADFRAFYNCYNTMRKGIF